MKNKKIKQKRQEPKVDMREISIEAELSRHFSEAVESKSL